jgi:hypothetical protein
VLSAASGKSKGRISLSRRWRKKNEIELETIAIGFLDQIKFCYSAFCRSGTGRAGGEAERLLLGAGDRTA